LRHGLRVRANRKNRAQRENAGQHGCLENSFPTHSSSSGINLRPSVGRNDIGYRTALTL
jgi:hypothetical protein